VKTSGEASRGYHSPRDGVVMVVQGNQRKMSFKGWLRLPFSSTSFTYMYLINHPFERWAIDVQHRDGSALPGTLLRGNTTRTNRLCILTADQDVRVGRTYSFLWSPS
jgi:hypothetical protein